MGILNMPQENGRRAGWPRNIFTPLMQYGVRPALGRIIGANLNEKEVARRAIAMPLHKARLGAAAVSHAAKTGDTDLHYIGTAMVAKALVDIEERPGETDVHAEVSDAVTNIAVSLPLDNVADNPYLAPHIADKVSTALDWS